MEKNKQEGIMAIVMVSALFIFLIGIFIYTDSDSDTDEYIEKINREFKTPKRKDLVQGVVKYIEPHHYQLKGSGSDLIILSSHQKIRIYAGLQGTEKEYYRKYLYDLIQLEDSIYKPANFDTFYLYRNKEEYIFLPNRYFPADKF